MVLAVEQEKPRFILIAGDLLPKDGGFNGQRKFFPALANYLGAMRGFGETTILTFFGNDDFHPLEPLLDDLVAKGLCVNLNGKGHREAGFVFCGMNYVRDYPFGYKHWCAPDGDYVTCPEQFCGEAYFLAACLRRTSAISARSRSCSAKFKTVRPWLFRMLVSAP
jgi:hypothetical protein